MFSIKPCEIPDDALLKSYFKEGMYTDCYTTDIDKPVSYEAFVIAFYTTFIFKLERLILKLVVSKPSTDSQVSQFAAGMIDTFAAWDVEERSENQLLLCDFQSRTRSWLMVLPIQVSGNACTRLYFGSAVVPVQNTKTGVYSLGWIYSALLGFHKLYSVILLYAAKLRLQNS